LDLAISRAGAYSW